VSPDLRLYAWTAGVWSAALLGLSLTAAHSVLLAVLVAAALAALQLLRRGRDTRAASGEPGRPLVPRGPSWGVWAAVGASLLVGLMCGAAATAARVATRDTPVVHTLAQQRAAVRVRLTVTDDPRPLSSGFLVPARTSWLDAGSGRVTVSVRVLVLATDRGWSGLLPGTPVEAEGRLALPRGGDLTAAVLDVTGPPRIVGPAPWTQRAAGTLRAGLVRACVPLPSGPRGLLPGLVVGDTSRLPASVVDDFRATGMTHLVAVSGANLAIVGGLVLGLARWCRAGPRTAAVLCALSLAGFVILARPSPSVLRAAGMAALTLLALAVGRQRMAVPALAAAVGALLLVDPALAVDPGFALSACATGGLLLLAPGWRDALRRRRVPAGLAEALAVPAAAQVACSPVIAAISASVSLSAVPANLLAEPAVAPATVLGVLAAVASPVWPGAAGFLAWLGSWPTRWLLLVAHTGAGVPAGVLPWPGGTGGGLLMAALIAAALVVSRRPVIRLAAAVCALAAVLGAAPVAVLASGWPPEHPLIVACDVGQGDGIVLPVAPGRAVVVDTGPEPTAINRCLGDLGVSTVDLLVLTHFHADHVGGIAGAYQGRRVGALLVSRLAEPPAGAAQVAQLATARRTPVLVAAPGWTWQDGPLRLTVLGPVRELRGTDSDPNNNSLVIRAEIGGERLLLAGDAQTEEQDEILSAVGPAALRADVLKLAHHGSAKQSGAFLDAVRAPVVLVSVGVDNGYGLPNQPVLDRLTHAGARVLRTDRDGDCAVLVDHGALAVLRRGVLQT
jgi:competence protein ComEC